MQASRSTATYPTDRTQLSPLAQIQQRLFKLAGRGIVYLMLVVGSLIFLLPFWWMLTTSIKELSEVFQFPPTFFPQSFTVAAYNLAWVREPWPTYLGNTLQIVFGVLAGVVISSTLCAYGFARLRFPGRDIVFIIMLSSLMLPSQVTLIPTYIFFRELGWLDTLKPLIVPAWFGGGAFNIFLMRQFFTSIPMDLVDAARIDGCSHLGIWRRIMLPLAKPAVTVITVLTFQGVWNDFFGPLVFLNSRSNFTLALGLQLFQLQASSSASDYGEVGLFPAMMAACTLVTLPVIIVFVFAQRYFVEGIQMTGLKA
jgi:multiple sugar transport system permease protein